MKSNTNYTKDRSMTAGQLAKTCSVLFGQQWKTALASRLGMPLMSIHRWSSGKHKIPTPVAHLILRWVRSKGTVLSLCDRTGNMVRPWADAGFECLCVDLQHKGSRQLGNITYIGADLLSWLPPPQRYAMVFAFPECTNVAVSGARWFRKKGIGGLSRAVDLLETCRRICEWSKAPWMIENPVSVYSSYWRKPDHTFDPCEFGGWLDPPGDAYTKKTCLWTGNDFIMPERKPVEPAEGSKMHRMPPSKDRANRRSETPRGFALAVFEANAQVLFGRNASTAT
ncbi:hypothetical protein [Aeoliella sp.]|uniref:hypothetical protein n=1 Tax=Aeoliella sp. TaxID=2795800 RepID=UPI003CCBF9D0